MKNKDKSTLTTKRSVNYKKDTKKQQLLKELEDGLGIVTNACKTVNIARNTFYSWLKEDPAFKAKVDEINTVVIDFVETEFYKKIQEGDTTAMIFFLKSKGKARGWNEKTHVEFSGNVGLTLPEQEREIYNDADVEKLEKIKEIISE